MEKNGENLWNILVLLSSSPQKSIMKLTINKLHPEACGEALEPSLPLVQGSALLRLTLCGTTECLDDDER